jgi:hypothetical protein
LIEHRIIIVFKKAKVSLSGVDSRIESVVFSGIVRELLVVATSASSTIIAIIIIIIMRRRIVSGVCVFKLGFLRSVIMMSKSWIAIRIIVIVVKLARLISISEILVQILLIKRRLLKIVGIGIGIGGGIGSGSGIGVNIVIVIVAVMVREYAELFFLVRNPFFEFFHKGNNCRKTLHVFFE